MKFYAHVQRRYKQLSCEPCGKFFAKFIRKPQQYYCPKEGSCPIQPLVEYSDPYKPKRRLLDGDASRCNACWLKVCMEKFIVGSYILEAISQYIPRLEKPPFKALIDRVNNKASQASPSSTEPTSTTTFLPRDEEAQKQNKKEENLEKHSSQIKLLPRKTQKLREPTEEPNVSIESNLEKKKIVKIGKLRFNTTLGGVAMTKTMQPDSTKSSDILDLNNTGLFSLNESSRSREELRIDVGKLPNDDSIKTKKFSNKTTHYHKDPISPALCKYILNIWICYKLYKQILN